MLGQRKVYETGIAQFGVGVVVAFNAHTEIVTIQDENDGSIWVGPADLITQCEE